jgi:preprotein translocase subunit SecG
VLVLHVIACVFLIAVVLLQQGKGQDLAAAFGGGTQTAFGPRGSANILSRATTVLAGVFMITSVSLSVIRPKSSSFLEQVPSAPAAAQPAPQAASPASPAGNPPAPAAAATEAPAAPAPAK